MGDVYFDFEYRCRLCFLNDASISLFSTAAQHKDLIDSIQKYLNIEISLNDELPKHICEKCYNIVYEFNNLFILSWNTQEKFQLLITENQNANPHVPEAISNEKMEQLTEFIAASNEECNYGDTTFSIAENNTIKPKRQAALNSLISIIEATEMSFDEESLTEISSDKRKNTRLKTHDEREEEDREINEFYKLNCIECDLNFDNFCNLLLHCKSAHKCIPTIKCNCGKTFSKRNQLLRHIHQHLGIHRYKCEHCGRGFHFKFMLRSHVFTHGPDSEKPYKCAQCSKNYITKSGLRSHILMKHSPHRERLTCDICQNTFSHPNCLYSHKKTVHGDHNKHFVCHICGKTMSTSGNLNIHIETHRETNVQCEVCGKRFKTRMRLVRHMEYHREILHNCNICGRTFQTRGALRSHLLVHSDLRPHVCNLCNKSFKRSKQLKLHLHQHTGAKPYKCPFCPKTFTNAGNRATHKRRIHAKNLNNEQVQQPNDTLNLITPSLSVELITPHLITTDTQVDYTNFYS